MKPMVNQQTEQTVVGLMLDIFEPIAHFDINAVKANIELSCEGGMSTEDRTIKRDKVNYLLDNFAIVVIGLVVDNQFRDTFKKAVTVELSHRGENSDNTDVVNSADSDIIVIDFSRFNEQLYRNIHSRLIDSFEYTSDFAINVDEFADELTDEDMSDIGLCVSNFLYLLRAFSRNDEFWNYVHDAIEKVKIELENDTAIMSKIKLNELDKIGVSYSDTKSLSGKLFEKIALDNYFEKAYMENGIKGLYFEQTYAEYMISNLMAVVESMVELVIRTHRRNCRDCGDEYREKCDKNISKAVAQGNFNIKIAEITLNQRMIDLNKEEVKILTEAYKLRNRSTHLASNAFAKGFEQSTDSRSKSKEFHNDEVVNGMELYYKVKKITHKFIRGAVACVETMKKHDYKNCEYRD